MSVTSVEKDLDNNTLTVIADFDAPVERVWELWADPRKIERWWGPPTHPATFTRHELEPGGEVAYFMTAPDGQKFHGWWRVNTVEPPTSLSFTDGFADDEGRPLDGCDSPQSNAEVTLSETDGGTRMVVVSTYASREDFEKVLEMGVLEGTEAAMGQMDAVLSE